MSKKKPTSGRFGPPKRVPGSPTDRFIDLANARVPPVVAIYGYRMTDIPTIVYGTPPPNDSPWDTYPKPEEEVPLEPEAMKNALMEEFGVRERPPLFTATAVGKDGEPHWTVQMVRDGDWLDIIDYIETKEQAEELVEQLNEDAVRWADLPMEEWTLVRPVTDNEECPLCNAHPEWDDLSEGWQCTNKECPMSEYPQSPEVWEALHQKLHGGEDE